MNMVKPNVAAPSLVIPANPSYVIPAKAGIQGSRANALRALVLGPRLRGDDES